jgi:hypothetical protein
VVEDLTAFVNSNRTLISARAFLITNCEKAPSKQISPQTSPKISPIESFRLFINKICVFLSVKVIWKLWLSKFTKLRLMAQQIPCFIKKIHIISTFEWKRCGKLFTKRFVSSSDHDDLLNFEIGDGEYGDGTLNEDELLLSDEGTESFDRVFLLDDFHFSF